MNYLLIRGFWTCIFDLFNEHTLCNMSVMKLNGLAGTQHSYHEAMVKMVISIKAWFPCLFS